jgi:acylphosphatase
MAEQYGIRGFVRNNYDGSVEVVAEGEDEAIKQFVTWCRRGPPAAVVHSCEENREDPTGEFKSFSLRH